MKYEPKQCNEQSQNQQYMFATAVQFLKKPHHKNANINFFQTKIKEESSFLFYKELNIIICQIFLETDKRLIEFVNKFGTQIIIQQKQIEKMKKYVVNAKQKVKNTLQILIFLHKIKNGMEAKQIITQFHVENIQQIFNSLKFQSSCILKAKIYTILILVKDRLQRFQQGQKIFLCEKCVKQRRNYEKLIPQNLQFLKTTFYISTKWISSMINQYVDKQSKILQILKEQEEKCNNCSLNQSYKQVYLNNLKDLKEQLKVKLIEQIVPRKRDSQLLVNKHETQTKQKNILKTRLKLEETESNNFINSRSVQKMEQFCKKAQKRMLNQNRFDCTSKKSLLNCNYQNKIEKSKSLNFKGMYKHIFDINEDDKFKVHNQNNFNSSAHQKKFKSRSLVRLRDKDQSIKKLLTSSLSKKIQIFLEYQKVTKQLNANQRPRRRQKKLNKSFNSQENNQDNQSKGNEENFKPKNQKETCEKISNFGKEIQKQISQFKKNGKTFKKKKIASLYKAFAFNNKVIDICQWKLIQQKQQLNKMIFFQKNFAKDQLTQPIKNFQAGIKKQTQKYQQLITTKSQFRLKFIKIWLGRPLFCQVKLNQVQTKFNLQIQINGTITNICLHRGNNILCQRFITIWPTLRYLTQKKVFQFAILKKYQNIFTQVISKKKEKVRNKGEKVKVNNDIQVGLFYKYFGQISTQEAQEIGYFLDFCYKFISLITQWYRKQNSIQQYVKNIGQDCKVQVQCPKKFTQIQLKMKSKIEISLLQTNNILLCSFFNKKQSNFFFVKVFITRQQIFKLFQCHNKSKNIRTIELLIYFRSNFKNIDCSSLFTFSKIDLRLFNIKIVDFVNALAHLLKFGHLLHFFSQNFYKCCLSKIYIHYSLGISTIQSHPQKKCLKFIDIYSIKQIKRPLIQHDQTAQQQQLFPISLIENYLDLFSWQKKANNVLLPNSKWRLVQKKIKTILSFMNHLSKVTRRKSSLLASQRIRQYREVEYSKKSENQKDVFTKTILGFSKTQFNCSEKIQNQPCQIKVCLLEKEYSKKWISQIIICRSNSKKVDKFYFNNNDSQILNNKQKTKIKSKVKQQLSNSHSNDSNSIQYTQSEKNQIQSEDKIQIVSEPIKQRNPRQIINDLLKRIDYMKVNCFKKVYLHGDFQDFRLKNKISQYMKQDLEKAGFKNQYISPFKHYFQTLISKPIKIKRQHRKEFGMLFLIKLKINSKVFYQFKLQSKNNQFHYAFQMSEKSMVQILNTASSESISKSFQGFKSVVKEQFFAPSIVINLNDSQKQQKQKPENNVSFLKQTKLSLPSNRTSILSKIPQNFQPNSQDSFLSLIRCLDNFSKQVFQTLMHNVKIQEFGHRMILTLYDKKKLMHKRILQKLNSQSNGLQIVEFKDQHQDLKFDLSSQNVGESYSNIFRNLTDSQNQDILNSFRLVLLKCFDDSQQNLEKEVISQMEEEQTLQKIQFQNQKRCIKYGFNGKKIQKMGQVFMKFYELNFQKVENRSLNQQS